MISNLIYVLKWNRGYMRHKNCTFLVIHLLSMV